MSDPNAGHVQILRRTLPWVRLVSVVGFGIAALCAVFAVAASSGHPVEGIPAALIVYPVFTVLSLVPSIFLYRYASRIRTFVAQGHSIQLEAALDAQRAFWQFVGIIALVVAALAGIGLAAAVAIGVLAAL